MSTPVPHPLSAAVPPVTADDLQILAGIASIAPIPYRPTSPLAIHKLIVEGEGGAAVITPLGARELQRAIEGREPDQHPHDSHRPVR